MITPREIEAKLAALRRAELPLRPDGKVDINMFDLLLRRMPDSCERVTAIALFALCIGCGKVKV